MKYILTILLLLFSFAYGFSLFNHNVNSDGILVQTKQMTQPADLDFNYYGNQALADSGISTVLSSSFFNSITPEIICNQPPEAEENIPGSNGLISTNFISSTVPSDGSINVIYLRNQEDVPLYLRSLTEQLSPVQQKAVYDNLLGGGATDLSNSISYVFLPKRFNKKPDKYKKDLLSHEILHILGGLGHTWSDKPVERNQKLMNYVTSESNSVSIGEDEKYGIYARFSPAQFSDVIGNEINVIRGSNELSIPFKKNFVDYDVQLFIDDLEPGTNLLPSSSTLNTDLAALKINGSQEYHRLSKTDDNSCFIKWNNSDKNIWKNNQYFLKAYAKYSEDNPRNAQVTKYCGGNVSQQFLVEDQSTFVRDLPLDSITVKLHDLSPLLNGEKPDGSKKELTISMNSPLRFSAAAYYNENKLSLDQLSLSGAITKVKYTVTKSGTVWSKEVAAGTNAGFSENWDLKDNSGKDVEPGEYLLNTELWAKDAGGSEYLVAEKKDVKFTLFKPTQDPPTFLLSETFHEVPPSCWELVRTNPSYTWMRSYNPSPFPLFLTFYESVMPDYYGNATIYGDQDTFGAGSHIATPQDERLITSEIAMDATDRILKFFYYQYSDDISTKLTVYVNGDLLWQSSGFKTHYIHKEYDRNIYKPELNILDSDELNKEWAQVKVDLSSYKNQKIKLTFRYQGFKGATIGIDYVTVYIRNNGDLELPSSLTCDKISKHNLNLDLKPYIYNYDKIDNINIIPSSGSNISVCMNGTVAVVYPKNGFSGSDWIKFDIYDGKNHLSSDMQYMAITDDINPQIAFDLPPKFEFNEDESTTFKIADFCTNFNTMANPAIETFVSDSLSYTLINNRLDLKANKNWFGKGQIKIKIIDNTNNLTYCDSSVVEVRPVDDLPVFILPDTLYVNEDDSLIVNFKEFAHDIDNYIDIDNCYLDISSFDKYLSKEKLYQYGSYTGNFLLKPQIANFNGSVGLIARVRSKVTITKPVTISFRPVNDPPVIKLPELVNYTRGDTAVLNLYRYLSDVDNALSELNLGWNSPANLKIERVDSLLKISSLDTLWQGSEDISFALTDQAGSKVLTRSLSKTENILTARAITQTVKISCTSETDAPVLISLTGNTVKQKEAMTLTAVCSDASGIKSIIAAVELPDGIKEFALLPQPIKSEFRAENKIYTLTLPALTMPYKGKVKFKLTDIYDNSAETVAHPLAWTDCEAPQAAYIYNNKTTVGNDINLTLLVEDYSDIKAVKAYWQIGSTIDSAMAVYCYTQNQIQHRFNLNFPAQSTPVIGSIRFKMTDSLGYSAMSNNFVIAWDNQAPKVVASEIKIYSMEDNAKMQLSASFKDENRISSVKLVRTIQNITDTLAMQPVTTKNVNQISLKNVDRIFSKNEKQSLTESGKVTTIKGDSLVYSITAPMQVGNYTVQFSFLTEDNSGNIAQSGTWNVAWNNTDTAPPAVLALSGNENEISQPANLTLSVNENKTMDFVRAIYTINNITDSLTMTPAKQGDYNPLLTNNPDSLAARPLIKGNSKTAYSYSCTIPPHSEITSGTVRFRMQDGAGNRVISTGYPLTWQAAVAEIILMSEDFEKATFPSTGWLNTDQDGDKQKWYRGTAANSSPGINNGACAASRSWNNTALKPDNYLITPEILLPAGKKIMLNYLIAGTGDWPEEYYKVKLSTTGSLPTNFTTTLKAEQLTSSEFKSTSIDISAQAGKKIRLAFEHCNCTDLYTLRLDNIIVKQINAKPGETKIEDEALVDHTELYQNNPNPFNPVTSIKYALSDDGMVKIKIYNITGTLVTELNEGMRKSGYYSAQFNGAKLASGVYIYALEFNGTVMMKRTMMLLK